MYPREVELEPLEPRDGAIGGIEIDVEAEHHQRVDEGRRVAKRVGFEDELGIVDEQHAVPRIRRHELDAQLPGQRGILVPDRVLLRAVRPGRGVLLNEAERAIPFAGVAVVHRSDDLTAARWRGEHGRGEQEV